MFEFRSPFAFGYSSDGECIFRNFIYDMLYMRMEFEFLIENHTQVFGFRTRMNGCSGDFDGGSSSCFQVPCEMY